MHTVNKPLAVMGVAITKTLTSTSTASLSTKTTTNGPAFSDIAMVTPDPPFVGSNDTTAIYMYNIHIMPTHAAI